MDVLELRALQGPNVHARTPMLHLLLDATEEADQVFHDGDLASLLREFPGLPDHACGRGTFGRALDHGVSPAHLVEHVMVELLRRNGQQVSTGRTEERGKASYLVTIPILEGPAAVEAARRAVDIVDDLCRKRDPAYANAVDDVAEALRRTELGPTTRSLLEEAARRGIPAIRLDEGAFVQFGHGHLQRRMQASLTDRASCLGAEIADDKDRAKELLQEAGVPVPQGDIVWSEEGALKAASRIGYPVVLKPLVGNHGRGITTEIDGPEDVPEAFALARQVYRSVVVERHVRGRDHRILLVDHKVVAAVRRDPAQVVGDGERSVRALVDALNEDPRRSANGLLARVEQDEAMLHMLTKQGLDPNAVPEAGRVVLLRGPANVSAGGTATDVTDEIHPKVRDDCERASRAIGLDITGLDIVAASLAAPLEETGGAVVEINAAPGLRMHMEPSSGTGRDVTGPIFDMLFPTGDGRIPILAFTGQGAGQATRLAAELLRASGKRTGVASDTGVEALGAVVRTGDQANHDGAQTALRDRAVEVALLQCDPDGVVRRGLGFDQCRVAVLLPPAGEAPPGVDPADHDEVPHVLVDAVARAGAVVAADGAMASLARRSGRRLLMVATRASDAWSIHLAAGGEGVHLHDGAVALAGPDPATLADAAVLAQLAPRSLEAILAAAAAAYAAGMSPADIRQGLAGIDAKPAKKAVRTATA